MFVTVWVLITLLFSLSAHVSSVTLSFVSVAVHGVAVDVEAEAFASFRFSQRHLLSSSSYALPLKPLSTRRSPRLLPAALTRGKGNGLVSAPPSSRSVPLSSSSFPSLSLLPSSFALASTAASFSSSSLPSSSQSSSSSSSYAAAAASASASVVVVRHRSALCRFRMRATNDDKDGEGEDDSGSGGGGVAGAKREAAAAGGGGTVSSSMTTTTTKKMVTDNDDDDNGGDGDGNDDGNDAADKFIVDEITGRRHRLRPDGTRRCKFRFHVNADDTANKDKDGTKKGGVWKERIHIDTLTVGQKLHGVKLEGCDLLDGRTGPKIFFECGIGRTDPKSGRWHIVNAMLRLGSRKSSKSATRKRAQRLSNKIVPLYVSKIRRDNAMLEVSTSNEQVQDWIEANKKHVNHCGSNSLIISASTLIPGQELNGTIVRIEPYGAFVNVGANRNGLLHVKRLQKLVNCHIDTKNDPKKSWAEHGLGLGSSVNVSVRENERKRLFLDFANVVKEKAKNEKKEKKKKKARKLKWLEKRKGREWEQSLYKEKKGETSAVVAGAGAGVGLGDARTAAAATVTTAAVALDGKKMIPNAYSETRSVENEEEEEEAACAEYGAVVASLKNKDDIDDDDDDDDNNHLSDDEAAEWAAFAAGNDDGHYDEDDDIEDALGISTY